MTMPIQRPSLVGMAVDELIKLISERGLGADDPIPPASELADLMDVSRTVVREAIAELGGQGLLRRRQGRETVVTLPNASQLERLLRLRFAVQGADFEGLQQYRSVLEVGSARLAAEKANPSDITSLKNVLSDLQQAKGGEELHLRDQAFHREVARISGNDMVLLTLDGISPLLFDLRQHAWAGWTKAGGGLRAIIAAHEEIYNKIAANDPSGAETAMRDHLEQAAEGLHNDLRSDPETDSAVGIRTTVS